MVRGCLCRDSRSCTCAFKAFASYCACVVLPILHVTSVNARGSSHPGTKFKWLDACLARAHWCKQYPSTRRSRSGSRAPHHCPVLCAAAAASTSLPEGCSRAGMPGTARAARLPADTARVCKWPCAASACWWWYLREIAWLPDLVQLRPVLGLVPASSSLGSCAPPVCGGASRQRPTAGPRINGPTLLSPPFLQLHNHFSPCSRPPTPPRNLPSAPEPPDSPSPATMCSTMTSFGPEAGGSTKKQAWDVRIHGKVGREAGQRAGLQISSSARLFQRHAPPLPWHAAQQACGSPCSGPLSTGLSPPGAARGLPPPHVRRALTPRPLVCPLPLRRFA